jgi:hypothetical protein
MSLHANPVDRSRRPRTALLWIGATLLAVTVPVGCGALTAGIGLPFGVGGYGDSSDGPTPAPA